MSFEEMDLAQYAVRVAHGAGLVFLDYTSILLCFRHCYPYGGRSGERHDGHICAWLARFIVFCYSMYYGAVVRRRRCLRLWHHIWWRLSVKYGECDFGLRLTNCARGEHLDISWISEQI